MRERYENHPGINISRLKGLAVNPKVFLSLSEKKTTDEEEPEHFFIGNAVERFVCYGEEEFKKSYAVMENFAPSGMLYVYGKELSKGENSETAYKNAGYDPKNIGIKKVEERFEKYIPWLNEIQALGDKTPISSDMYENIVNISNKVTENNFVNNLLQGEFQKELYWEEMTQYGFVPCKGLADVFQEFDNEIVLTDIKTSSQGVNNFERTILKYRYDLQAAWYCLGAEKIFGKKCRFNFLVIDVAYGNAPIVYSMTDSLIEKAKNGYISKNGWRCKGCKELINEYMWHTTTNSWEYPKEVYETSGIIEIDSL